MRITDLITRWVLETPDHPALIDIGGPLTYAELANLVSETQQWLVDSGVRAGDRVMLVGENCNAFAVLILAVAGIDAWPVPVNAHLSPREVDHIRIHSGARRVVYTTSISLPANAHAQRDGANAGGPAKLGGVAISPLCEGCGTERIDRQIGERVAALIYTSGTTGVPKGVMLTNKSLIFTASGSAMIRSLTPNDRVYGALPIFHVVGLSTILLGTLLSGATLFLVSRFDPMRARVLLDKEKITILLGVPAMFAQFVRYAKIKRLESLKFPSLRIISCSGAPLDASLKLSVEKLMSLPLHHAYGITECSPNVAQTRTDAPSEDLSVGKVFPGVKLKIVSEGGEELLDGSIGNLLVSGPNVMKGYYRDPEQTAAVITPDGWFKTGDLARIENGNLFIVGRSKDLIIRSGFNVYPAEIESVLNAHPSVAQSAVIGRSVEGDEEVLAFVQPLPDSPVSVSELAEHSARHLAPYKRPTRIFFVSEMPLTSTGKVKKAELSKLAFGESATQA